MALLLGGWLAACVAFAGETDRLGASVGAADLSLPAGRLVAGSGGLTLDGRLLDAQLVGPPSAAGGGAVWSARDGDRVVLRWLSPSGQVVDLTDRGDPDRAALDAQGQRVAWIASEGGLPCFFARRLPAGPVVALANVGLSPRPGGPPAGFLPPPHLAPLRWEGDDLVWESPQGTHRLAVSLP
jgi:hypothetical protein